MSAYFKNRVFVCHDTALRDKVKNKIAFYVICIRRPSIPRISPVYNSIFVKCLISKFILKVFVLIAATNIQRKIVEMKEEIRAMTVVKNYVHKYRLWDYNDASLVVNSKIEIKRIVCKSVTF
jgi:hypothetical protein